MGSYRLNPFRRVSRSISCPVKFHLPVHGNVIKLRVPFALSVSKGGSTRSGRTAVIRFVELLRGAIRLTEWQCRPWGCPASLQQRLASGCSPLASAFNGRLMLKRLADFDEYTGPAACSVGQAGPCIGLAAADPNVRFARHHGAFTTVVHGA